MFTSPQNHLNVVSNPRILVGSGRAILRRDGRLPPVAYRRLSSHEWKCGSVNLYGVIVENVSTGFTCDSQSVWSIRHTHFSTRSITRNARLLAFGYALTSTLALVLAPPMKMGMMSRCSSPLPAGRQSGSPSKVFSATIKASTSAATDCPAISNAWQNGRGYANYNNARRLDRVCER